MEAGDLDRKVDILTLDTHKNTLGEMGKSLSPFALGVWMKKEDVSGKEEVDSDRKTAFGQTDFTARFRSDLKETMVLICEGVTYDILNIREGEGRKQWTVIEAKRHD